MPAAALASDLGADLGGDRLLAHGFGGQADLPIPLNLAIAGAMAALVVSFTILAMAWRTPRYADGQRPGRPAPALLDALVRSRVFIGVLRGFGLFLFCYTFAALIFGENLEINPALGIFYVWLWVGVPFASALFGPVWKAISPGRAINALLAWATRRDPDEGLWEYPARLGYWPAAVGLYAYVWMELAYPFPTEVPSLRLWVAVYFVAMLLGGVMFGNSFYRYADPFEVFSSLIAKCSIWAMDDGRLMMRSPLKNLDSIAPVPGLIGVVAVLFGSTAFDSFRESTPWIKFIQSDTIGETPANYLCLLAFCVGAGLILMAGAMLTGVGPDIRRSQLPDLMAHSIVPIILGYFVAHYLTYFWEVGQETLRHFSDPFSTGADYFGTAGWVTNPIFREPETQGVLASIKVLAVVIGHVVGAVVAHERAIQILPKRHQLTGQLSMLAAMVAFTAGGLYLLFAA